MNRSAKLSVNAMSSTGTLSARKGRKMDASASVNCVEVVVKVITKLAMITSEMRTTYMSAFKGNRIADPDEDEDRQRWQEHTAVILERNARSDHDTQQDRCKNPQPDPRAHTEQRNRKEQQQPQLHPRIKRMDRTCLRYVGKNLVHSISLAYFF